MLEFGVLAMEIVLQAIQIATAFPMTHGQVVEQIVATGLWACGRYLALRENPLEALNGEAAHILYGIAARHDDIHTRETTHRANVNDVVLGFGIAEPSCHQVLQAMHSSRCNGGLLIGLGDAEVECRKALVLARNVDAWLQAGMIDGETLYDFHDEP